MIPVYTKVINTNSNLVIFLTWSRKIINDEAKIGEQGYVTFVRLGRSFYVIDLQTWEAPGNSRQGALSILKEAN